MELYYHTATCNEEKLFHVTGMINSFSSPWSIRPFFLCPLASNLLLMASVLTTLDHLHTPGCDWLTAKQHQRCQFFPESSNLTPCLCSLLLASGSNLVPNSTLQDQSGVETQLKAKLLPSTTSTTCYQSKAAKPSVSVPPRCLYHTNANSISPSGLIRVLKQLLLL